MTWRGEATSKRSVALRIVACYPPRPDDDDDANVDAICKNMIIFTRYLADRCISERDNGPFFVDTLGTTNAFRQFYRDFASDGDIRMKLDHPLEPVHFRRASTDLAVMQYHSNMKNHILMNLRRYFIRYIEFLNGLTHVEAKYYVDICMDPEHDYVNPDWGNIVDFKHPEVNTMSFIPLIISCAELLRERQIQLPEEHRASGSRENFKLPRGLCKES